MTELTHFIEYDAAGGQRPFSLRRSVCGALIPNREHVNDPTCAACRAWLTETDAMDFGQPGLPIRTP